MNPVELIRELADDVEYWQKRYCETAGIPWEPSPRITRAQAFLAAQPVVVEVTCEVAASRTGGKYLLWHGNDLLAGGVGEADALAESKVEAGDTATVHVVVTPGAR